MNFQEIIDSLPLLSEHREELRIKRGFSDEVIDKLQFRSCSSDLIKDLNLSQNFKNSLKHTNIIIPYFGATESGYKIVHIRPHKFGIEGLKSHVYVPFQYMGESQDTLVIAESEFKAVASCLMGVPAIGVPGISSFVGDKFEILSAIVQTIKPKKTVILFDKEIKSDPDLPNFKPDFTKRYDTEYYAYVLCQKLSANGVNCQIGELKSEWMVNGKADIDGVYAAKIDSQQYIKCVENSKSSYEYKSGWSIPDAHKGYMERRINRYFYKGPIELKHNCYWRNVGGRLTKLTNFKIQILHAMYDAEGGIDRKCRLISEYGKSQPMDLLPDYMTSKAAFRKFCYMLGDYEYYGNDDNLQEIWSYVFMYQDGRIVNKINYFGYNEDVNGFFFGNGLYKDDRFYAPDDSNIVWYEDIGYRLPDEMQDLDVPRLSAERNHGITVKSIYEKLASIMTANEARLIIGWTLGNFFMPEILKTFWVYPFIFLYGKQESGKSTISNWMSSFFGFEQKGINFHSTNVGISRITNQMSMIPIWLEEYRNGDKDIGKKNNFLRSIYDRSTIVKGSKREGEIKSYRARSTLIVSGEEHPKDAALNSRCIQFPIYRETSDTRNSPEYEWLQSHKSQFNEIGDYILLNKKELWPVIKKRIQEYINAFKDSQEIKIGDRQRIHMSIVGGICDTFISQDQEFTNYLANKAVLQNTKVKDEQALYIYFEDLMSMYATGKLKSKCIFKKTIDNKECCCFWSNIAYSEWEVYYRGLRNDIPASKAALLEHLKREPYYIGYKAIKHANTTKWVYLLDYAHEKFPSTLGTIMESIENESQTVQSNLRFGDSD